MPNTKASGKQLPQLVILVGLLAFGAWFWLYHQYAIDTAKAWLYTPSSEIAAIADKAELTDRGEFLFYASQPELLSSNQFNSVCERREASSPILGCYTTQQIYLFDVSDERLDGIEEVTAAHEMLHAAYEDNATDDLRERMAYYERAQPGEEMNELHAILPTEFSSIGNELEDYYQQYFDDRQALVSLHEEVDGQFTALENEADAIVQRLDSLASTVQSQTANYEQLSSQLNTDIAQFNQRAAQSGGFKSEAEFEQARAELETRSNQLSSLRVTIQQNIQTYNQLVAQLEAFNTEAASLYEGLDSTISPAPNV